MKKLFVNRDGQNAGALLFNTIAEALTAANDGDIIELAPGVYKEAVVMSRDGVTLVSSEKGGVTLAIPDGHLFDPALWTLAEGCKNVYEQPLPEGYRRTLCREEDGNIIFEDNLQYECNPLDLFADGYCVEYTQVCGMGLHVNYGNGERTYAPITKNALTDSEFNRWTVTPKGRVQINLGGKDPQAMPIRVKDGKHVAVKITASRCVVKGITIEGGYCGFDLAGADNIVADCVVNYSYYGVKLFGPASLGNTIRRCCFYVTKQGVYIVRNIGGHIIEENFFIGTGQPALRYRSPQNNVDAPWGPGTAIRHGVAHNAVIRHNVIADTSWTGWWPDVNCYGHYFYGNVFTDMWCRALYNEYPVNDTRIYYNALTNCDSGIIHRFSWRCMNAYNYIANCRNEGIAIWGPHMDNGYRFDSVFFNNVLKNNKRAFYYMDNEGLSGGLPVAWPDGKELTATALTRLKSHIINDNLYGIPENGLFAAINKTEFKTLEDYRAITGQETSGKCVENPGLESYGLSLYTVNIPLSKNPDNAVAYVGNPIRDLLHCDLLPIAAEDSPYFWEQGEASSLKNSDIWEGTYGLSYEWPNHNKPVRRLIRTRPGLDPEAEAARYAAGDTSMLSGPGMYMEFISFMPDKIEELGSGFWSPSLPAVSGKELNISFYAQCEKVKPFKGTNGFTAFVHFTDLEGKNVSIERIKTADMCGEVAWARYDNSFIIPAGVSRYSVFLGMLPCEADSTIRVGEIHLKSGELSPPNAKFELPRFESGKLVDLSHHYNHELDKDTGGPPSADPIDKFIEDYCAMSKLDLSKLTKGSFDLNGIPVRFDRAVTLATHRRPPLVMPFAATDIAVNEKAKAMAFFTAGDHNVQHQENFRFVVHYKDGTCAEVVPVRAESEMHYKEPYFCRDCCFEGLGAAVLYDRYKGILCFVWVNPKPECEIKAFDFMSMDAGNAVLLSAAVLR